jgi:hypothetical protein
MKAEPLATVAVPSAAEPSLKVIVPVALTGRTEAVNVTDWPKVEGFSEEMRLVVVDI